MDEHLRDCTEATPGGSTMGRDESEPDACRADLTVLYDGACPLCRREIALYRRLNSAAPVQYCDVSRPGGPLPPGRSRLELLARFHVVRSDGRVLDGAPAFIALWAVLPGWRWLARLARLPGAPWLLDRGYQGFLRLRPRLQRWAARRDTGG
jgi:predicted DCC family thiol-disulfide oxidoreductase YuxK